MVGFHPRFSVFDLPSINCPYGMVDLTEELSFMSVPVVLGQKLFQTDLHYIT